MYTLIDLEDERRKGRKWLFGPLLPESSAQHTKAVEIGYVNLREVEGTDALHFHAESEEYYIILRGYIRIQVGDEIIGVSKGQVLLVKPQTHHFILEVEPDTQILLVKAPCSGPQKLDYYHSGRIKIQKRGLLCPKSERSAPSSRPGWYLS